MTSSPQLPPAAQSRFMDLVCRAIPFMLAFIPLSFALNLGLIQQKGEPAGPYVLAIDIIALALIIALVVAIVLARNWRRLRWPPFLAVALFAWFLTGLWRRDNELVSVSSFAMLKESVQFFEYFIVGYVLFLTSLYDRRSVGLALDILCTTVSVVLAVALFQFFGSSSTFEVRGLFDNNTALSAFLAVSIPLVAGNALAAPGMLRKFWMIPVLVASLLVVLNGFLFIGMMVGIVVLFSLYGRWVGLAGTLVVVLLASLLFAVSPRNNTELLYDSATIYHRDSTNMVPPGWEKKDFVVSTRIRNWQAALFAAKQRPLLGFGPSSYANAVKGEFYFDPKFPASTADPAAYDIHVDEPGSFSTWFVLLVEQGLLGLLLFILFALMPLRWAMKAGAQSGAIGHLGKAAMASLIAFFICAGFTSFLEKGLAFLFVFLVALSFALYEYAMGYRESREISGRDTPV